MRTIIRQEKSPSKKEQANLKLRADQNCSFSLGYKAATKKNGKRRPVGCQNHQVPGTLIRKIYLNKLPHRDLEGYRVVRKTSFLKGFQGELRQNIMTTKVTSNNLS